MISDKKICCYDIINSSIRKRYMRKDFTMELTEHRCGRCGAELEQQSDTRWKCKYCGCTYDDSAAVRNTKNMREMFDDVKMELVNNCRRNLFDAVNAEYISTADVKNACAELKKYLPDDFRANFYEIAVSHNERKLTSAIRKIDIEENYEDIEYIVRFLIKSLQTGFLLELNNLIERAFKNKDLRLFEKYATEISVQAEKVQMGVYETKLPREVFVAYSSKDMDKVSELVEILESQGLKCFVAARNLRHGKGSVENYDKALKEAIDHCKSFVFVSTMNSRSFSCDALEIEIPYVQKKDTENAPAEYRNNYAAIPHKYKKPRVEYRLESSKTFNAADEITKEFFDGYEWVLSPSEVAIRIMKQLVAAATPSAEKEPAKASAAKKYCINCGSETGVGEKFCSNCGKSEFVGSIGEYVKLKNQKDIETRRKEEARGASSQGYYGGSFTPVTNPGTQKPAPEEKKKGKGGKIAIGVIGAIAAIVVLTVIVGIVGAVLNNPAPDIPAGTDRPLPEYSTPHEEYPTEQPEDGDNMSGAWGSVNYEITEDGVLTITGDGDIPALYEMDARPWNEIDVVITKLKVEEGITSIGEAAFTELYGLESVILPSTLTHIRACAFENVYSLRYVEAPGVENIDEKAFSGCALSEINVGDRLLYVASDAFNGTDLISEINSHNALYVGPVLVKAASDTKEIFEIRDGTTAVAADALRDCELIKHIIIPESVQVIGDSAFYGTYGLETFEYKGSEDSWNLIEFGASWNERSGSTNETGYAEIIYCNGSNPPSSSEHTHGLHFRFDEATNSYHVSRYNGTESEIIIPSVYLDYPVVGIDDNAFQDMNITAITIPDMVESIGSNAFLNCSNLTGVKMSQNIKSIGERAFFNCSSLEKITLPDSLESIEYYAFAGTKLYNDNFTQSEPLYIGKYLIRVSEEASGVLEIKDGTVLIADYALCDCIHISSVVIPTSVKYVGNYAFANMYSLETAVYSGTEDEMNRVSFGEGFSENAGSGTPDGSTSIIYLNGAYDPSKKEDYSIGLEFAPNSDMTGCIVSGYNGNDSVVIIPSIYLGYPVTEIADDAFSGKGLVEVKIPATVTKIGNNAFRDCYALNSVSFADGATVSVIGSYAFSSCQQLKSIALPASVTSIGECVFQYCDNLESVSFAKDGAKLEIIPSNAFGGCMLNQIDIPDSVTTISEGAFSYNEELTLISFGENSSLKTIGDSAFGACGALKQLTLPKTVTSVDSTAFSGCQISVATVPACAISSVVSESLISLTVNGGETIPESATNKWGNADALYDLVIMDGVKRIEYKAFYGCTSLKNVTLPSSLELIGQNAFEYCTALESIVIPSSVTAISEFAFVDCIMLSSVDLPDGLLSIGMSAFEDCVMLSSIDIPNSVNSIGISAFQNCEALKSVNIPTSIKSISSHTFRNTGLESVSIPSGVEKIETYAFGYCDMLKTVELAASVTNVSENAFGETLSIKTVTAHANVMANINKSNLISVTVNGGDIDSYAFSGNRKLRHVKLCEGVQMIGDRAFDSCTSLISIEIPASVNSVSPTAFTGCNKIAEMINRSVIDVGSYIDGALVDHKDASHIKYVDGFAFITVGTTNYLLDYSGDASEISLPSNYNGSEYTVRKYAFYANNGITKVTVSGASLIEAYAFSECDALVNVTLGESVKYIGDHAFYECNSLYTVTLGSKLQAIGSHAFDSCTSLKSIDLPISVTEIGIGAFSYCSSLNGVKFIGGGSFKLYDANGTPLSNQVSASSNGATNAANLKDRYVDYRWERTN